MKLYTEEQVYEALELLIESGKHNSVIVESLTPIELPSDEEIDKKSFERLTLAQISGFRLGAKWMRDKIQGGNK